MDSLADSQPLDIVIADDDGDLAELHRAALESDGHRVEVASDGAAAIAAVKRTDPDLLILDLEMPGKSGIDVLEEMRAEPATVDQPVVVVSNRTLTSFEKETLVRLRVLDFLAKWRVRPLLLVGWVRGWAAAARRYAPRRRGS